MESNAHLNAFLTQVKNLYGRGGGGVYEKLYGGLTKRGVYENLIVIAGGHRKFTAKGGGVYEKIPDFDEFRPIPPSDIKWTFP